MQSLVFSCQKNYIEPGIIYEKMNGIFELIELFILIQKDNVRKPSKL